MTNRAAYVLENRKMELRDCPMPEVGEEDVLVQIEYCGVCGSDVHFYTFGEPEFPDVYPFILGHECAGEVIATGSKVTGLMVGDKVALEPGITCGHCEWCKSGRYNLCPSVRFLSAPTYNGALRKYVAHPADLCFKLPENISTKEGALIEPLSVGLYAGVYSGIKVGDTACILGSGCIGLVTLLALKAMGISDITVVDLFDIRLNKALELGATRVINSSDTDAVQKISEITKGRGTDFVFETAGNKVTAAQSVYIAKRGGTVMMVGNVVGETPFNFQKLTDKEITIKGTFRYKNIYPIAIDLLSSGRLDIKQIISNLYAFKDTQMAYEDCINNKMSMIKAVIDVAGLEKA